MSGKLLALHRSTGSVAEMSDAALVAACGVGETAALGALFDRHRAHVRRFIGHLAGSDERDLDDLVQATFLELHRSARRFRGDATVRSWIFGIAVNVVRQHVRGERRRRNAMSALEALPAVVVPSPEGPALRRQQLAVLARAVEALPHDLRVAFVMCDVEEIAGTEAARGLGLRPGTLWRRLYEARQVLRAALQEGR